jgi:4-hydroxybenzoate polyprenyltransferase
MSKVKSYLSLIKFSHTIFAMPFALIGFCLAVQDDIKAWIFKLRFDPGPESLGYPISIGSLYQPKEEKLPIWLIFLFVVLCMVFARSAAMAFNRYLDRTFDAKNPRTAIREIPSGVIKANNALVFTIINSLLFVVCTFFINKLCFYLSPVALLVVLGYSYTKRFTPSLSFDTWFGAKSCTDWGLSCSNRKIRSFANSFFIHSFILGQWL